jgi:hypothetical protein
MIDFAPPEHRDAHRREPLELQLPARRNHSELQGRAKINDANIFAWMHRPRAGRRQVNERVVNDELLFAERISTSQSAGGNEKGTENTHSPQSCNSVSR